MRDSNGAYDAPQRSIVSILVADVVDSTKALAAVEPEDVQLFLDHCFDHVRAAVEGHGGTVVHFTGDGAIAIFGWPNALEDHADLACGAAVDVIKSDAGLAHLKTPNGEPVAFRVGVHSGLVVLRTVRTGPNERLDAIGEAVHLAAALQKSAPAGHAFISQHTQRLCRGLVQTSVPDQVGIAVPKSVTALDLQGIQHGDDISNSPMPISPIFGRAEEMDAIAAQFTRPDHGKSSICLVGEPGIGKSRLMREAGQRAQAAKLGSITVFCVPLNRSRRYNAVTQLLQRLMDLNNMSTAQAWTDALDALDLPSDVKIPLAQIVRTQKTSPVRTSQTQTTRAFIQALNAAVHGRSLVICVEDIHEIDAESATVFTQWRADPAINSCTILFSSRPAGQELATQLADTVLPIRPIIRSEMQKLARHLLDAQGVTQVDIEALIDRADGVPFVLEQLSRNLTAAADQSFDPLPPTVESAIHAQINRMSPDAKRLLHLLSVVGNDNKTEFLSDILSVDRSAFNICAAELKMHDFVEESRPDTWRFRHDILLDACLNMLHRSHRVLLNKEVLQKIDGHADMLTNFQIRKAVHARGAGDAETALKCYWIAALDAVQASAGLSLEAIFDQAMDLIEEVAPAAEKLFVDFALMAFDSMHQIGKIGKIDRFMSRAAELASQQGRPDRECMALGHMATACWYAGRNGEGKPIAEKAFQIAKDMEALPLIFYTQFTLANVIYGLGELDRAIDLQSTLSERLQGELETARLGASLSPASISRSFLAYKLTDKGEYERALGIVEDAIDIAERVDQPYSIAMAKMSKGRLLNAMGRYAEAEAPFRSGLELVERDGMVAAHPSFASGLATCLSRQGAAQDALDIIERCVASGDMAICTQHVNCGVYSAHYEALRALGRNDEAQSARASAISLATHLDDPISLAKALSLPARIDASEGIASGDETLSDLETSMVLVRKHGFKLPHSPLVDI
ncbi:MAG: AAA family ATPase [Hyphomonadaceae bacterium]